MIVPLTAQDIQEVAELWYLEKPKTCFGGLVCDWTAQGCGDFIKEVLDNPQYHMVCTRRGTITGVCGVMLGKMIVPPHLDIVTEWMWFGSQTKDMVSCLQECLAWGTSHGAILGQYGINQKQSHPHKFIETYQWRVL